MRFHESPLFSKEWNRRTSRLAFMRAVVSTFSAFAEEGLKPSSTYWTTNHAYFRAHAMPRVAAEWSKATGLPCEMFPWSEDEVATTWEEWRKTNQQYRGTYLAQLGMEEVAFAGPQED